MKKGKDLLNAYLDGLKKRFLLDLSCLQLTL